MLLIFLGVCFIGSGVYEFFFGSYTLKGKSMRRLRDYTGVDGLNLGYGGDIALGLLSLLWGLYWVNG